MNDACRMEQPPTLAWSLQGKHWKARRIRKLTSPLKPVSPSNGSSHQRRTDCQWFHIVTLCPQGFMQGGPSLDKYSLPAPHGMSKEQP